MYICTSFCSIFNYRQLMSYKNNNYKSDRCRGEISIAIKITTCIFIVRNIIVDINIEDKFQQHNLSGWESRIFKRKMEFISNGNMEFVRYNWNELVQKKIKLGVFIKLDESRNLINIWRKRETSNSAVDTSHC